MFIKIHTTGIARIALMIIWIMLSFSVNPVHASVPLKNETQYGRTLPTRTSVSALDSVTPTYNWHTFFASGWAHDVSIDQNGNIYLVGYSVVLGLNVPDSTPPLSALQGGADIVVVKLNRSGEYQWHTFLGSSEHDYGKAIGTDSDGNIYIAGQSYASWNGPNDTLPLNAFGGDQDMVLVKLNGEGIYQWHTFFGTPVIVEGQSDNAADLTLDTNGNVYVIGRSADTWNGPGSAAPQNNADDGGATIIKLDANGNYEWHTFYGVDAGAEAIRVDDLGNIYIAGISTSNWPGPNSQTPLHAATNDVFGDLMVLKLDSLGVYQWHTFYGSINGPDWAKDIDIDSSGNIYIAGLSWNNWNAPTSPLNAYSGGTSDIVVVKLNSSGGYQWHTFYGSSSFESASGISVADNGSIVLAGAGGATWYGPGSTPPLNPRTGPSPGSHEITVLALDSNGMYQWHTFYGSATTDYAESISTRASSIVITGDSRDDWNGPGNTPPLNPGGGYAAHNLFAIEMSLPRTLHVKWNASGSNDGSSWENAYTDLQSALSAASSNDEIWVAAGTYKPTTGTDRTVSFILKSGVSMYGGFAGTETLRTERNYQSNVTVLSGDIGTPNDNADNSYHVVIGSGTSNTTVLDGFTITAGNANGGFLSDHTVGGGMRNISAVLKLQNLIFSNNMAIAGGGMSNVYGSPSVVNVTFSNNAAGRGGAMLNQDAIFTVTNGVFINNSAANGGAIFNDHSFVDVIDSSFASNSADYGGGIYHSGGSAPTFTNVTFSNNSATYEGGAIYNALGTSPEINNSTFSGNSANKGAGIASYMASPVLSSVAFNTNSATYGGGMYNRFYSDPTLTDVTFSNNTATSGGGIYNEGSGPILTHATFIENTATNGGGMYNKGTERMAVLDDVAFLGNTATGGGGGIYNENNNTIVKNTVFIENTAADGGGIFNNLSHPNLLSVIFDTNIASENGGGMYNEGSSPILTDLLFIENSAVWGGGMYNENFSNPSLIDVTFSFNTTFAGPGDIPASGGAIFNTASNPMLTNVTMNGNSAEYGGGLFNEIGSSPSLLNVTLSGNTAVDGGGILNRDASSSPSLTHVTISGNSASNAGGAIANAGNPIIVNSILWANTGGEIFNTGIATPTVTFSIVQGGHLGDGNFNADPRLGPLQDNGGFTETMAIDQLSAAVDAGNDAACIETDQRWIDRPQGDHCDIGAYEFQDTMPPAVVSIQGMESDPTNLATLHFKVTFNENVIGVDVGDFSITKTGITGPSITMVTGSEDEYDVTVRTGSGNGTLRLDLLDNDSIKDESNHLLGGAGTGNGSFTHGETYTVLKLVPSTPVLLSPANAMLVSSLQPAVDWKDSLPDVDHYQLQVSTNNTFTALVVNETNLPSSSFEIASDLPPGKLYYWRVKALNIIGGASAWSPVWNFKTPLAQPSLVSPSAGETLLTNRPALKWDAVEAATQYIIQVSPANTFASLKVNATLSVTEYNMLTDLPQNQLFFWRVRAKNTIVTGNWSDVRTFTSGNPPSVPVLVSPVNNSLSPTDLPLLKWRAVTVPAGTDFQYYELQVDDNVDFSSPEAEDISVTDPLTPQFQLTEALAHNTKFFWRVRAVNRYGLDDHVSAWSTVWNFRTKVDAPVLVSPPNSFDALTLRPDFDWNAPSGTGTITGYTIQISKNDTFTQVIHTGNPISSNYIPNVDLLKGTTLYWRVLTKGMNGPSAWSASRSFTSANSPTTPMLSLPASNALLADDTPLVKWNAVTLPPLTDFLHYQVQVASDAAFSSLLMDDISLTDRLTTQIDVSPALAHNMTFYWRVRAVNDDNEVSNWSVARSFRIKVDGPTLISPINGDPVATLKPTLDWDAPSGTGTITNYSVQISTSPTFSTLLVNSTSVSTSYTPLVNLPPGQTIYWRVKTNGANGPSLWVMGHFVTP